MPKPNPLTQGLKQATKPAAPQAAPAAVSAQPRETRKTVPASRLGRVLIGGHFDPEVQTALKIVAAQERTSLQALLAEGINAVFARRQKPQIAALSTMPGREG